MKKWKDFIFKCCGVQVSDEIEISKIDKNSKESILRIMIFNGEENYIELRREEAVSMAKTILAHYDEIDF